MVAIATVGIVVGASGELIGQPHGCSYWATKTSVIVGPQYCLLYTSPRLGLSYNTSRKKLRIRFK
jgi:hypothetical protein